MGKALTFNLNRIEYSLEPVKLERKKLYGWTETLVLDKKGKKCKTALIDQTGTLVIPKGGLSSGILNSLGNWVDKSELIQVDSVGNHAEQIPSSFDSAIELKEKISADEFLEYNITSIYSLKGEENCPDLIETVTNVEGIFSFEFNFRASYDPSSAFLVESKGELFVLIGQKNEFEYIGLENSGLLDEDDDSEENDDDELDFSMF